MQRVALGDRVVGVQQQVDVISRMHFSPLKKHGPQLPSQGFLVEPRIDRCKRWNHVFHSQSASGPGTFSCRSALALLAPASSFIAALNFAGPEVVSVML